MKRIAGALSLSLFLTLLVGCGGPDDKPVPTVIAPETTVIGGVGERVSFDLVGDVVVFDDPTVAASIEPGSILVSAEGDGLLRRAVSVRNVGGRVEVDTVAATLTEAIESGELSTTLNLGQSLSGDSLGLQNSTVRPEYFEPIGFDLTDLNPLYQGTVSSGSGQADLLLEFSEGGIWFTPDIDLNFRIQNREIDRFSLTASGELQMDAVLRINATGQLAFSDNTLLRPTPDQPLYRHVFVQWVGWVPIVQVVTFDVEVGYELEANAELDITAGGGITASVKLGATWEHGDWTPVYVPGFETRYTAPALNYTIAGFGRVYFKPMLDVMLYGFAGPQINLEGGPRLDFDTRYNPRWTLAAELEANAEFNVTILDHSLAHFDTKLFYERWPLAQDGDAAPIVVQVEPARVTLAPGDEERFTATVTGTSDGRVDWSATGGGVSGTTNTITYTAPTAPGTYRVTATSVHDPTASATATVTVAADTAALPLLRGAVQGAGPSQNLTATYVDALDGSVDYSGLFRTDNTFALDSVGSPPTPTMTVAEAFGGGAFTIAYGGSGFVTAFTGIDLSNGGLILLSDLTDVDVRWCSFDPSVLCFQPNERSRGYADMTIFASAPFGLEGPDTRLDFPAGWSVLRITYSGEAIGLTVEAGTSGMARYYSPAQLEPLANTADGSEQPSRDVPWAPRLRPVNP